MNFFDDKSSHLVRVKKNKIILFKFFIKSSRRGYIYSCVNHGTNYYSKIVIVFSASGMLITLLILTFTYSYQYNKIMINSLK